MLRKIIYITLIVMSIISCKKNNEGDTTDKNLDKFLTKSNEGVYINSSPAIEFNVDLHQVSVNTTKLTYRIQTDAQDNYMHCVLSAKPSKIGDSAEIVLNMQVDNIISFKKYTVTLEKILDSTMWLWESNSKTGFIITL